MEMPRIGDGGLSSVSEGFAGRHDTMDRQNFTELLAAFRSRRRHDDFEIVRAAAAAKKVARIVCARMAAVGYVECQRAIAARRAISRAWVRMFPIDVPRRAARADRRACRNFLMRRVTSGVRV
jgi:hypothetical protein